MEAPWQSLGHITAVHCALHAGTWAAWEEGWTRLRAREQPTAVHGRRPRWHSRAVRVAALPRAAPAAGTASLPRQEGPPPGKHHPQTLQRSQCVACG